MADQLLIALAATTIINLATLLCVFGVRTPPRTNKAAPERAFEAVEHTREMLLIDIRRREQLLDIRLKRLERATSIR
jgi:hypothetical protein